MERKRERGEAGWQSPVPRPMSPLLPPPCTVGQRFYRQREGAICRNSTASSGSHLEIGHQCLISIILIVLSIANLQFQSWFISISLRPIL